MFLLLLPFNSDPERRNVTPNPKTRNGCRGGNYPNTTTPKKATIEKSEEVLDQRDVQPLFVNVDFKEICHQAARAKKVLVLAIIYPGNNEEHMARTTFRRRGPFSELMILTPKVNNPSLNLSFSGESLKDVSDDQMEHTNFKDDKDMREQRHDIEEKSLSEDILEEEELDEYFTKAADDVEFDDLVCELCSKKCKSKVGLKRHKTAKHKDQNSADSSEKPRETEQFTFEIYCEIIHKAKAAIVRKKFYPSSIREEINSYQKIQQMEV
ncbi:hypothetical protein AWC38_SpisGene16483 [Stylophora pistillata]|uniref:C2H2-type domain-containing protein n=1 Tax=Stylophora pistillata TaxID=50429 RepID=A0A2B4RND1_STYPI|nr:hypothetical protein AWC38_SpisGene16483 [Stylophora pistillata]